jgi:hypothetical protein
MKNGVEAGKDSTRSCPKCASISSRVSRRGVLEQVLGLVFLMKPFECARCKYRYLRVSVS